jgi:hypothetical protein
LGLFEVHWAFISFSFSRVSFIFDGFALAGGGDVDCADAVCRLAVTSNMAAR